MLTAQPSTYDKFESCHMLTAEPSTYDNFLFLLLETNRKTCHMLTAQTSTYPFISMSPNSPTPRVNDKLNFNPIQSHGGGGLFPLENNKLI